jgi:hypothetical protein
MFKKTFGFAVLALSAATAAQAQDCTGECWRQETTPAQYGVVQETVQVAPSRTIAVQIPAQYGVVQETVQVSPGGKVWSTSYDAYGRPVMCLNDVPAQYGTVNRTVMTQAPQTVYQTSPAQYAVVARTQQIAPASSQWVPVSGGGGYATGYSYGAAAPAYGYAPAYRGVRRASYGRPAYGYARPAYGRAAYGYGRPGYYPRSGVGVRARVAVGPNGRVRVRAGVAF